MKIQNSIQTITLTDRLLELLTEPKMSRTNLLGLAHQLSLAGEASSVTELRQKTATELRTNSGQYLPFLSLAPGQFEVS